MSSINRTGSVQDQNRGSEPTNQFRKEYISVYIKHTNIHWSEERDKKYMIDRYNLWYG
jgi:hypothetical protein